MKANEYQIKTIQDIMNCVNRENLDNFMVDLKALIEIYITFQSLSTMVAKEMDLPPEIAKIESEGFTWIDDGKHDMKVELKDKKL